MTEKQQLNYFQKGFPWMKIVAPATIENGIHRLSEKELKDAVDYYESAEVKGRCKFVPASGAASRMFKDIYALKKESILELSQNIEKFAFFDVGIFGKAPYNPELCARKLVDKDGLGYGEKPKGVLKFHRYPDGEVRTALAEHLVEGQAYMREPDGTVHIRFTISPEHESLFKEALAEVKDKFEKKYGVKYDIRFTFQDKTTDTIAVNPDNSPFITDEGNVLKRPAGHGALISNLGAIDEELVAIKNIDNVASERLLDITELYKKALAGYALKVRDAIFGFIYEFDQMTGLLGGMNVVNPYIPGYNCLMDDPYATDECQELCNRIEDFFRKELSISMPEFKSSKERALFLRSKLDRPVRACGMVLNTGEPGGGPFIIKEKDGSTSLQILESAEINPEDEQCKEAVLKATHFNPVDIVCCLRDSNGEKFKLENHINQEAGFISSKSYQGRPLKALELPGLWNGSMSDWNTIFIEVPIETFNPVKVVLDLLRPNHQ